MQNTNISGNLVLYVFHIGGPRQLIIYENIKKLDFANGFDCCIIYKKKSVTSGMVVSPQFVIDVSEKCS